jgi:membrane protein DedA with SNARE-associated domain
MLLDPGHLLDHWGYLAIFLVVILGNVGLPVPEETILALAGYLVWRGPLRLVWVIAVGIASAAVGDNLGYWFGRRCGRAAIERYGHRIMLPPERMEKVWRFVNRHGARAVFAARFLPGIRIMAGPLAGAAGMRFPAFLTANVLGALLYVPYAVGVGYAVGYGLGEYVERLRHVLGEVEHVVLICAAIGTLAVLARRALRVARTPQPPNPQATRNR